MNTKKAYITLFILVATELIGFGLIIPILPQISTQFTSSGAMIGILLSTYSFSQFIAAPILGQLSDKFGRKPVLIFSKIGTIASYILLAHAQTYWMILISRALDGFTGGNIAVARAYLTDITDEKNRSKAMALIGIAFGTGFILGPAMGGICYSVSNNFSIAGYVGAALSGASLLITRFFLIEPTKKRSAAPRRFVKNIQSLSRPTLYLLFIYFVSMIIFSGFETSFSIYTENKFGFNESQNSALFFLIGIAAFFIQGSLTKLSIHPIDKAINVALICIGIGLISANMIQTMVPSLAMLVLLLFGISVLNTHLPAELSTLSDGRGFILGIYESIGSIGRIIGPLVIFSSLFNYLNSIYVVLGSVAIGLFILNQVVRYLNSRPQL